MSATNKLPLAGRAAQAGDPDNDKPVSVARYETTPAAATRLLLSAGAAAIDPTDDLIEALVTARERGLKRVECKKILRDVFNAPWTPAASPTRIGVQS
jgi:hypothetical protein